VSIWGLFSADPRWLTRLWPKQTHHWHTHVAHAVATLVLFAGNGYWVGSALPLMSGWEGFQLGGLLGLFFYLCRETGTHLGYWKMRRDGDLTSDEYKLHLWDSRLDFLVPCAVVIPVIGYEHDVWTLTGLVWALVIMHYLHKPKGIAGGMPA
jgi:hypothetical protein